MEESNPLDTHHPQTNHKSWILEEEDIDVEQDNHGKGEGDAADDVEGSDLAACVALGELLCDKIQDEVEAGEADEEEYMQFICSASTFPNLVTSDFWSK